MKEADLKVGTVLLSLHHEDVWLLLYTSVDSRNGFMRCTWFGLHRADVVVTNTLSGDELRHYKVLEPG